MIERKDFTKYEIARILGARALQVSMDAPLLLTIDEKKLEEIKFDPLKISALEFEANVLPITVKRPLPKKIEGRLKREKEMVESGKEEQAKKEEKEIEESGEIMELAKTEEDIQEEETSGSGNIERVEEGI